MNSPPRHDQTISFEEVLAAAAAVHQAGRLAEAADIYRQVLKAIPGQSDALHLLGLVSLQQGDAETAARLIGESVKQAADNANAHNNLGAALLQLGRIGEAQACFDRAIAANPGYPEAHNNRGNVLVRLGRFEDALASYDRAMQLGLANSTLHYNRGVALQNLGRTPEALAACDAALALEPAYADAHHNRGEALLALGQAAAALDSYDHEIGLAEGRADAHRGRGTALMALGRLDEALAGFGRSLALDPQLPGARYGRAVALLKLARLDAALADCELAIEREPGNARLHFLHGVVLSELKRLDEARDACARAIAIDPEVPFAYGHWLHLLMQLCDWNGIQDVIGTTLARVREGKQAADPFTLIATNATPADRLQCAQVFVEARFPAVPAPTRPAHRPHERLRLAYLSSDLQDHATAHLIAEVLERHDRSRFEVMALSFGPESVDPWRRRIESAVDRFHDVATQTDGAIADRLRDLEIDIAVDLKGYTAGARSGILARRPAPIQVNYLAYPGTMGAGYIDYLVADAVVIPPEHEACYTERIARLPHCYQPNLSNRPIADRTPSRAELGLPDDAFVFCCFNNAYKITPEVFDAWMRLLGAVPGSVLWLLEGPSTATTNLRREAQARGIAPERLVFAPRLAIADHLARHRAADLFLDTLHCNAHTTASDALWAGLPLVTVLGEAFPGRVAASLLRAAGLPELASGSLPEYEAMARRLACNPAELAAIRARLAATRTTNPLFDAQAYTRHLEAAYTTMWERHSRGLEPATFAVPA
ncbi:MAG: tetratricopeptide repeat protein [Betaproteobacteria bacterium]|nr:tetratricopeptide repeat protein [Betaproteobacteria bacterium]